MFNNNQIIEIKLMKKGLYILLNKKLRYNYNKLLESIGYSFDTNKLKLDILTPDFTNNSEKKIIYDKNVFEIVNKIEYTINNYAIIKQNTINLKNKISDKFFNMASYIMKLNNLLDNINIFINKPVIN
jgi:hypothetical protein